MSYQDQAETAFFMRLWQRFGLMGLSENVVHHIQEFARDEVRRALTADSMDREAARRRAEGRD